MSVEQPIHILLGVTGSVAAVKAPEIAVHLIQSLPIAQVKVLLTRGGSSFWKPAQEYAPEIWNTFESLQTVDTTNDPSVPRIQVHCECHVELL
jgi:phosphopantothenoylcysteine synthetase/decarboxylase